MAVSRVHQFLHDNATHALQMVEEWYSASGEGPMVVDQNALFASKNAPHARLDRLETLVDPQRISTGCPRRRPVLSVPRLTMVFIVTPMQVDS